MAEQKRKICDIIVKKKEIANLQYMKLALCAIKSYGVQIDRVQSISFSKNVIS
jgi:hypothetical protein